MSNALLALLLLAMPAEAGRWVLFELCTQDGKVVGELTHNGFKTYGKSWVNVSAVTAIIPLIGTAECSMIEMGPTNRAIVKGTPEQLFCAGIGGPACLNESEIK